MYCLLKDVSHSFRIFPASWHFSCQIVSQIRSTRYCPLHSVSCWLWMARKSFNSLRLQPLIGRKRFQAEWHLSLKSEAIRPCGNCPPNLQLTFRIDKQVFHWLLALPLSFLTIPANFWASSCKKKKKKYDVTSYCLPLKNMLNFPVGFLLMSASKSFNTSLSYQHSRIKHQRFVIIFY